MEFASYESGHFLKLIVTYLP